MKDIWHPLLGRLLGHMAAYGLVIMVYFLAHRSVMVGLCLIPLLLWVTWQIQRDGDAYREWLQAKSEKPLSP